MKNVTLAQLKSEFFNTTSVVEAAVEINPSDIAKSHRALESQLASLEALGEALLFKKEKLLRRMSTYDQQKYAKITAEVEAFLEKMQIPPLGDSRGILEKNKEILELKEIQKYLRYAVEIEKNPKPVLGALLDSKIKENWVFLAKLLFYFTKYRSEKEREVFFEYSKRIEEKMGGQFEKSLKEGDLIEAKAAFHCLQYLDKECLLLDEYMLFTGMLKGSVETAPPSLDTVDLDVFLLEKNSFAVFVDRIIDALEAKILEFYAIFGSAAKYTEYIFGKVYRIMIFRNLEKFLSIENPFVFLLCLTSAYKKLEVLSGVIKGRFPQFDADCYIREGFGQHLSRAIQKEKQAFDEVFDVFVHGNKATRNYLLLGEPVKQSEDLVRVYEKLLCVVHLAMSRCALLYNEEDEHELLRYFYRKMLLLVENIMAKTDNRIEIVTRLSRIYLLTCKYFGPKVALVAPFIKRIGEAARGAFVEKIENSNSAIRRKLEVLSFSKKDGHKACLECIKSCIAEAEPMKGNNYAAFVSAILSEAYARLHKQILHLVYSGTTAAHMQQCLDDFVGFVSFLNYVELVRKFSHLREIGKLISVEQELFLALYEEYHGSISEKELKSLIKCRKDKEKIRALLIN
ncbi:hypothetical protein PAPHI01_0541 [Pancytospora philotis]|nr:hypothetical protein PAPHI01_0541 [Pancytospora philotis]